MGSNSRYSALEQFVEKYGEELVKEYEELLLGKVVEEFLGTEVDYHVKADVRLNDNEVYETHYRWSTEEEDYEGKELEEDYDPMEQYYTKVILGRPIIKVTVDYERDDECYIYAYVDEENYLEIPLNFDPNSNFDEDYCSSVVKTKITKKITYQILDSDTFVSIELNLEICTR